MFSSIFLAGLLTTSTFASPIEIPAALRPRGGREFCDAKVFNDEPANDYCYQFCDLKVNNIVAGKRKSYLITIFVLPKIKKLEVDIICVSQQSRYLKAAAALLTGPMEVA